MSVFLAACQNADSWQEVAGLGVLAWAAAFAWWSWLKYGNK